MAKGAGMSPDSETPRPRVGRSVSVYPLALFSRGVTAVALLLRVRPSRWREGGRWSAGSISSATG
jgi:hypothetical protein